MEQVRVVRDTIEAQVKAFIANPNEENIL